MNPGTALQSRPAGNAYCESSADPTGIELRWFRIDRTEDDGTPAPWGEGEDEGCFHRAWEVHDSEGQWMGRNRYMSFQLWWPPVVGGGPDREAVSAVPGGLGLVPGVVGSVQYGNPVGRMRDYVP